jgi:hypothetical protein
MDGVDDDARDLPPLPTVVFPSSLCQSAQNAYHIFM